MKDDEQFLDLNYTLIRSLLVGVKPNIIDISYSVDLNIVEIQIVLLENTTVDERYKNKVIQELVNYKVNFNLIYISRDSYNLNKGNWLPSGYNWLPNVVLSKAEI